MFKHTKAYCGFSVDDLEKAREFYEGQLGLTVKDNPMGVLELHIEGSTPLIIYPKPDHSPATFTILNFPVDDVEATVDKLIQHGITFEQYGGDIATDSKGIFRYNDDAFIAWFKDPAGNILSVVKDES